MPIILATAATAALLTLPVCSWNHPGANPYRGTVAEAIGRYRDIDATVRDRLIRRIAANQPDDDVRITRDAIAGQYRYHGEIHDMYFGSGKAARLCRNVDRSGWTAARSEPGKVYCVDDACILVPRICGNISRIERVRPYAPQHVEVTIPPAPPAVPLPHLLDFATGTELGLADSPAREEDDAAPELVPSWPMPVATAWPPSTPAPLAAVPEPSTWAMLLAGVAMCLHRCRRATVRHHIQ